MSTLDAHTRAYDLLTSYLSPHQRGTYIVHGFFYVQGDDYRIYVVWNGIQVLELDVKGNPEHIWGISATGYDFAPPRADLMLAQMLLIETNTEYLKARACKDHYGYRGSNIVRERVYYQSFIKELKTTGRIRRSRLRRLLNFITHNK